MIDTVASTVAAPGIPPVAAKIKKTRGIVNQRQAQALTKAEQAGNAAKHPDKTVRMAARDITQEIADAILADVEAAREKVSEAVVSTTARKTATAEEKKAAEALLAGLQEVQKAAKQKYARTNRIALADYFVGHHLNGNRANLLQTSQAILDKLADDTLPGITTAKKTKLKTARQTWVDKNSEQTIHTTAALTKRAELKTMLKSIEDRRIAIQLAADAEWPHTEEEHAGIRKEFVLAGKRPMKG